MKKAFDESFLPPPPPAKGKDIVHEISTPEITVLPKATGNLPPAKGGDILPIHKMNPVIAIASELTTVITSISSSITQISLEKQRTAQVRAQAEAFKTQQYEMTKRTKIEQKEETKRAKIKAGVEISKLEQEWKIEEQRLLLQVKQLEKSQRIDSTFLENTEKLIESLLNRQNILIKQSTIELENGIYSEAIHQQILDITTKIQSSIEMLKEL